MQRVAFMWERTLDSQLTAAGVMSRICPVQSGQLFASLRAANCFTSAVSAFSVGRRSIELAP